jgi:hypothetical protein
MQHLGPAISHEQSIFVLSEPEQIQMANNALKKIVPARKENSPQLRLYGLGYRLHSLFRVPSKLCHH